MTDPKPRAKPRVLITSYGVLHGVPPAPRHHAMPVEVDLADALRNPHDDPGMRYLTGLDPKVAAHVMTTPGATDYRDQAVHEIQVRISLGVDPVEVFVYCRGGRHRSVAMAEAIGSALSARAVRVTIEHRDIDKPVVQAIPATSAKEA
jgi:RNase adaptor protein for sRNA GlmZ degradation